MDDANITREAITAVVQRTGLVWEGGMQDWDIEMVSGEDVPRLIQYYDELVNDVEKAVLMRLVIAAYDDCLQIGRTSEETEQFLVETLTQDWQLHSHTVKYWALLEVDGEPVDLDDGFKVSPLMRRLLEKLGKN